VRHGAHAVDALRALPIITYEARRVIKNQKNVRGLPHLMALKLGDIQHHRHISCLAALLNQLVVARVSVAVDPL
jgi:hypothetical protein